MRVAHFCTKTKNCVCHVEMRMQKIYIGNRDPSIFMRTDEASVNYPGTFVQHMFLPDSEKTGFLS